MTIDELTDGETMNGTSLSAVAEKLGVERDHGMHLYRWASDRGLPSDTMSLGGTGLSPSIHGIDAVEEHQWRFCPRKRCVPSKRS
jgi:hypothetical protein